MTAPFFRVTAKLSGFITGLVLAISPANAVEPAEYTALNKTLTEELFLPAYETLAIETSLLAETLKPFCPAPDQERLDRVRQRFHSAMDAWQTAQPIAFGPVWTQGGPSRVQFWPDKRGTGQRQLRRAIASEAPDLLAPGALASKSIALGDLQALERLLFDDTEALLTPNSFPCRFAVAIAEHQRALAAVHLMHWNRSGGFRDLVATAATGNAAYFDAGEASVDILRSIVSTLESIRLLKLERPMGMTIEEARGSRVENGRSARSLRNIALNLRMAREMITQDGGLGDLLAVHDGADIAEDMVAHLTAAIELAEGFDRPLSEMVEDETQRPGLEKLMALVLLVREIITDHAAPQINLVTGFNASDGD